jgi:hypothetical protein
VRRILILNLSLIAALAAISVRLYEEWITFDATHQTGAVAPERETFTKLASGVPPNAPAPANWTDIPSHNPFSFDRTDIAILEPKAPPPPPAPKVALGPKPVLFGTIIIGSDPLAMVAPGKPGAREYKPMKIGETIDGWTIVSIADKSVVIKGNEIQETILMNDPTAQVPRDHTRTIEAPPPPTVISIGGPPAPLSSSAAPAAATTTAAPGQASPQPGQRRVITQVTPFGVRQVEIEEPPK